MFIASCDRAVEALRKALCQEMRLKSYDDDIQGARNYYVNNNMKLFDAIVAVYLTWALSSEDLT